LGDWAVLEPRPLDGIADALKNQVLRRRQVLAVATLFLFLITGYQNCGKKFRPLTEASLPLSSTSEVFYLYDLKTGSRQHTSSAIVGVSAAFKTTPKRICITEAQSKALSAQDSFWLNTSSCLLSFLSN